MSVLRIYRKEAQYEFLRLLRARAFSLATIGFPLMFYVLFGIIVARNQPESARHAKYMLATYSIFGLVGACLFGICVSLAQERAQGWLELKQASPMPASAYLFAKLLTAMAFGLIIFGLLLTCGVTLGGVQLSLREFLHLLATVAGGVIPFAALGLLLASVVAPNAATGAVNLIYLPMSFLSGLWIPLDILPKWITRYAFLWPTWHMGQLALAAIGVPAKWPIWQHVVWLVCFSGAALVLALVLFRRNAGRA